MLLRWYSLLFNIFLHSPTKVKFLRAQDIFIFRRGLLAIDVSESLSLFQYELTSMEKDLVGLKLTVAVEEIFL